MDEGCTHQGSWGRVGDVAGTAMLKTQAAVQSRSINTFFFNIQIGFAGNSGPEVHIYGHHHIYII